MSKFQDIPDLMQPVVAFITHQTCLGISSWYEVVTYDGDKWISYHGSDTFDNSESVDKWRYVSEIDFG